MAIDFFISPLLGLPNIGMTTNFLKMGGVFEMLILSYAVVFRMRAVQNENCKISAELFEHISEIEKLEEELIKLHQGQENTISDIELSEREIEILTLIAQKRDNREIAEKLFISVNTVKYHVKKLYDKLDINSRKEALAKASELQIDTI